MRPSMLVCFLAAWAAAGTFRVVQDVPGRWEGVWSGDRWTFGGDLARGWSVVQKGLERSAHEGDLDAPRLGALLAVPAGGAWKLEILEDSGRILSPRNWARIPHVDPATGRRSPATPTTPPDWTERTTGTVRLVSLDLPAARLLADGSLRVRTRLRVRATWTGSVRPTDGTAWRNLVDNPGGIGARSLTAASRRAGTASSYPLDESGVKVVAVQVGDTSISSTLEDGVVRLTGAQLYQASGLSARSLRWRNVAVWAGSADTVPSANPGTVPSTSLHRLAVQWKAGATNDSILNPDDELRFWVRGTSIWKPDTTLPGGWRFSIHPYSRTRRYYVVLGVPDGEGSPSLGSPRIPAAPVASTTVPQPRWAGQPDQLLDQEYKESIEDANTGKSWFWKDLRQTSGVSAQEFTWPSTASLPGYSGDSAFATLQVASTNLSWSFPESVEFQADGRTGVPLASDQNSATWSLHGLSAAGNTYQIDNASNYFVVGYSVTYPRDVSSLDSGAFPAPGQGALSFPARSVGNCWVLEHGEAVRTCSISNGSLRDSATDPDTWYAVFGSAPVSRPFTLVPLSKPTQSHAVATWSSTTSADLVVVAPDEFLDVAESYALWRADPVQIRPMTVKIVRLQDVWDRWSSGAMDPSGLRDGLRWMWTNWGISHALLLGGGHVDPRGLRNPKDAVRIPEWEDGQVGTDDFFSWFDTTGLHFPAIALGRVPARAVSEAQSWLDKLKVFENPVASNLGPWRNTALFVADDQWQGANPDALPHSEETSQIADLAESLHPWIRAERFYEQTYPRDASYLKPTATQALLGYINRGIVAFNYIGHGAPTILADELLLDVPTFNRSVINTDRPYLFYAGSCTVGRHDDPEVRGLSEVSVLAAGKGSYAGIGGMRPTFSNENTELSLGIWDRLLDTTGAPKTLGEAIQGAKIEIGPGYGYQIDDLYNILGDPAVIVFPRFVPVSIDSIPDSLSALRRFQVAGRSGSAGSVQIRLDRPMPQDTFSDAGVAIVNTTPQQIVSASVGASSGGYTSTFLLPARIPFGDSARFSAYAWDPSTRKDGGAVSSFRRLDGTGTEIPSDSTGPDLRIRSCDSSWTAGITFGRLARVPLPFCLQVDLVDSSGISSSEGPDDGVVFSLTGVRDSWHPEIHQGADYRAAYAQLQLDSSMVQVGNTYTFQVAARDQMGNLSRGSLQIQPQGARNYALYDVFASPNPVRDGNGTSFYYKLSAQPDSAGSADTRIESSIRIHTVSGKLVRVLRTELSQPNQPRPRAAWDLRDSFGRPVANGLYPFTVTLRVPDATGTVTTDLVQRGIVAVSR